MTSPGAERTDRDRSELFVGLISGTSMDGVDAVVAALTDGHVHTVGSRTEPYPAELRQRLLEVIAPATRISLHELASLDIEVGLHFATTANALLVSCGLTARDVAGVGSHGQTLRHHPYPPFPYSIQIGDPATIAAMTGIPTIADFRSLDLAYGGQGAPLVPPFHAWCFSSATENRTLLNVGGIANVTLLKAGSQVPTGGFDTGPGNCLLDDWIRTTRHVPYDADGAWAASGQVDTSLLEALCTDPYFAAPLPKSTGREYFNLDFLSRHLARHTGIAAVDVQATLNALSVETIARAIPLNNEPTTVVACGGGVHNQHLMRTLAERLAPARLTTTAEFGVDPDYVEAAAFAWLAQRRLEHVPVNLTTTSSPRALLLGASYLPQA